ncbi:hypothetical protein GCM10025873_12080 [Demequina sediminis]|nr:hypothetical protein GCM10025873_12080 [Demequina sediminis]
MVVVLVLLEVLGEVLDALREHRDLNLGGTGVALAGCVLGHDGLLHCCVERHCVLSFGRCAEHPGLFTGALETAAVLTATVKHTGRARSPATGRSAASEGRCRG